MRLKRFSYLTSSQKENIGSNYYKKPDGVFHNVESVFSVGLLTLLHMDLNIYMLFRKQLGEYPLLKKLGEGKCSVCFFSETSDGIPVVVKYLKKKWFFLRKVRLHTEINALSKVDHPAIPKVLGVLNEKYVKGFVMEYKPGKTLADMVLEENKCFSFSETVNIYNKTLDVIAFLHGNGMIHRDINARNVMYHNHTISLIDFGFSQNAVEKPDRYQFDFARLANLLLFLLYSDYHGASKGTWAEQLDLTAEQMVFIKRLFGLLTPYQYISEVQNDFQLYFLSAI